MESKWKPLSTGLTKRPGDKPTTGLALYKFRAVFQPIMLVMFVKFLICICVVVISCSITWETCCWSSEVYKQEFENLKLLGDKKWPLRFDHFDCRDGAERMGLERAKNKLFQRAMASCLEIQQAEAGLQGLVSYEEEKNKGWMSVLPNSPEIGWTVRIRLIGVCHLTHIQSTSAKLFSQLLGNCRWLQIIWGF